MVLENYIVKVQIAFVATANLGYQGGCPLRDVSRSTNPKYRPNKKALYPDV